MNFGPTEKVRWTMSVHSVQNTQATQTLAVSEAQTAQKQSSQTTNALPQDKVTISAEAQAKQTPSSIGANLNYESGAR